MVLFTHRKLSERQAIQAWYNRAQGKLKRKKSVFTLNNTHEEAHYMEKLSSA